MHSRFLLAFSILLLSLFMVLPVVSVAYSDKRITYFEPLYTTLLTATQDAQTNTNSTTGTSSTNLSDDIQDDDVNGFERTNNDSLPYFSSPLIRSDISNETELDNTILGNDSSAVSTLSSTSSNGFYPGTLQIPYTGLTRYHLSPDIANLFGLNDTTYAILVTEVEAESPAEKAGIRGGNITTTVAGEVLRVGGDIILKVDGNTSYVRNNEAFQNLLRDEKKVGDVVTLTILRDGKVKDIEMNIGAMPLFLWYGNKDEGIKMKYPSDWEVSEAGLSKQDIIKFFSQATTLINRSSLPVAGVFVRISPSDIGLDSIARNEQEDTENTRNLDMFLTDLSSLPAYERVYYDYSNAARTLKILTVFTIKDDQLYRINFAADPPRYDDYLPMAREMIKSFHFTN